MKRGISSAATDKVFLHVQLDRVKAARESLAVGTLRTSFAHSIDQPFRIVIKDWFPGNVMTVSRVRVQSRHSPVPVGYEQR